MNSIVDRTKKFFTLTVSAAAVAGTAAMGFGAAIAGADPPVPPDPCQVNRCQLNRQPLPPGVDIDALTQVVMDNATSDAQNDLQQTIENMKGINGAKAGLRDQSDRRDQRDAAGGERDLSGHVNDAGRA